MSPDDLLPVLQFESPADAEKYAVSRKIMYRTHDGVRNSPDGLRRLIDIGTHLPVFVRAVSMQKQRYSRIELTHVNDDHSVTFNIGRRMDGRFFVGMYHRVPEIAFEWITAGGHGGADDGGDA